MTNQVVIITGASSGIGRVTALELARQGAHVFMANRSKEKSEPVIDEIINLTGNTKVELLQLDLADLDSVRAAAKSFLDRNLPLHILINNAGLAGHRGLTKQGFELTFGTNHLGHFLLTSLLLDKLKASAPSRIINVSSKSHYSAKRIDWDVLRKPAKTTAGLGEYAVSKLANVLFTKELARRLEGTNVTTYALHPGVVATDVWRKLPSALGWIIKLFMKTSEEGAKTTVFCATSPELANKTGRYYDESKEKIPSPLANDEAFAAELWKRSTEWCV